MFNLTKKTGTFSGINEETLRLHSDILNHIGAGVCLTRLTDGQIIFANPAFEKMHGYVTGTLVGKDFSIVLAPTGGKTKAPFRVILNALKKGGGWHGEVNHIKKGGLVFWCNTDATTFDHSAQGQVMVSVHADITQSKAAYTALQNEADKYRALFTAARYSIMIIEPPTWQFTLVNPAAVKMFQAKSEASLLSYTPWQLSPKLQPDGSVSAQKAPELFEQALREGVNLFEWVHRRVTGEDFFTDVMLSRIDLGGKSFLRVSIRDISAQKKAQNILEKFNRLMVGRELEMKRLKKEIASIKNKN